MPVATLKPVSDAVSSDWGIYPTSPTTHYDKVDDGDPHDGSSTYIFEQIAGLDEEYNALFNPESNSIPSDATINHVTVGIYAKRTSTLGPSIRLKIKLGANESESANVAASVTDFTEYTEQFTEKPGGGAFAQSDIANIDFGVWLVSSAKSGQVQVTDVRLEVDWEAAATFEMAAIVGYGTVRHMKRDTNIPFEHAGTLYAPEDIETDRMTNPTTASDTPLFTGIVNFQDELREAEYVQIQIGTVRYGSDVWSSDWIAISSTAHGVRIPEVSYAGSAVFGSGRTYYVRMRLKDDLAAIGAWSDELATFSGVISAWWDQGYAFRNRVGFAAVHDAFAANDMLTMTQQTGLREVISGDGFYDEGLSYDSHSIVYHMGKTHVVYLGEIAKTGANPEMPIMVATKDHLTGLWNTPTNVGSSGTSFDTHYYAAITVTTDGKLQIFYGCHNTAMKYRRSLNPNDSTSWISEVSLGGMMTYPHAFVLPNNHMFVIARGTYGLDNLKISLNHSTDGGATWSGWKTIANNDLDDAHRTYCPGVRIDYDATPWRLHVALYFVILPTGYETGWAEMCLYAYSDYDSEADDGFYEWYTHNDDLAGRTDTGNPIQYHDLDPAYEADIIYQATAGQRDEAGILFCYLDSNRSPHIILNTMPWGGDRWHGTLGIAKIDGTGWDLNWFTKALDVDVWHGRQGGCAMMDVNNIIRVYHIMCPKRYSINLPTGNGTHTAWTKSDLGKEYFEHVDDDRLLVDESIYLTTGWELDRCSFTHSFDLPEHAVILAVDVSYFARTSSGTPQVKPFLRLGSTDYDADDAQALDTSYFSSNWPVTGHGEYHYTWWLNPATAADWVEANLTGLQSGFKYHDDGGGTPTIRLARIQCRVLIMQGGHKKWFAGELVEFSSADDGDTWSYRFLTGNSSHGLPIVSMKERLTNRRIELIYVQGNRVLYYEPRAWGMMRPDGNDLRLIYNGVEIDRLALDHFNLVDTEIAFQAQDVVASNALYPLKNLCTYYGNNGASPAKMDPINVFSLLYEGFETYEHGTNLNGVGGWTVPLGSAIAYQASRWVASGQYNHNNKIYAGLQAAYLTGSATSSTLERTIGSGVTDIVIEVTCWLDNPGGTRAYLEIEDGSSNIFRVGLYNPQDKGQYYDTSWHDTSVAGESSNQYRLKVRITSSGVTAWFRDEQVVTDNNVLTSVDKLRLKTEATGAYFDHVRIYNYIPTQGVVGADAREYHGLYSDATIIGLGKRQNVSDAKINGYRTHLAPSVSFATRRLAEDVTVLPHEHGSTMSLQAIESLALGTAMSESIFLVHGATRLMNNVAALPFSISSKAGISQPISYELKRIMSSQGFTNFGVMQQLACQSMLPIEMGVGTAAIATIPYSCGAHTALASIVPFDNRLAISNVGQMSLEILSRILTVSNQVYAVQSTTGLDVISPFGLAGHVSLQAILQHDIGQQISVDSLAVYDVRSINMQQAILGLGVAAVCKLSTIMHVDVAAAQTLQAMIDIETLGGLSGQVLTPFEVRLSLGIAPHLSFDVRALAGLSGSMNIEQLQKMSAQALIEYGTQIRISLTAIMPFATAGFVDVQAVLNYQASLESQAQTTLSYGQLASRRVQALLPFINTSFMRRAAVLYFGNRAAVATQTVIDFGALLTSLLCSHASYETLQRLPLATNLSYGVMSEGQFVTSGMLSFGVSSQLRTAANLCLEHLIVSSTQVANPFDIIVAMSQAACVPFDALAATTMLTTTLPFDINLLSTTSTVLAYSRLRREHVLSLLALDNSLAVRIETHLPFDVRGTTKAVATSLSFDLSQTIRSAATIPMSVKAATSVSVDLPFSISSTITAAAANLPIEQLRQMEIVANTMHSVAASVGVQVLMQLDVSSDTKIGAVINFEYSTRTSIVQVQVSLEALTRLAIQANLPIEIIGYIFMGFILTDFELTGHSMKLNSVDSFTLNDWSGAGHTITVISVTPGISDRPEASWPLENLR